MLINDIWNAKNLYYTDNLKDTEKVMIKYG